MAQVELSMYKAPDSSLSIGKKQTNKTTNNMRMRRAQSKNTTGKWTHLKDIPYVKPQ
jgi:hypothetical protein